MLLTANVYLRRRKDCHLNQGRDDFADCNVVDLCKAMQIIFPGDLERYLREHCILEILLFAQVVGGFGQKPVSCELLATVPHVEHVSLLVFGHDVEAEILTSRGFDGEDQGRVHLYALRDLSGRVHDDCWKSLNEIFICRHV